MLWVWPLVRQSVPPSRRTLAPPLTGCPIPHPEAYHVIKHTCSGGDSTRSAVRAGPGSLLYYTQMLTVSPTGGHVSRGAHAFLQRQAFIR